MSEATQNSGDRVSASLGRSLSPWRWRPIWQGFVVGVIAVSAAVYGTRVSSYARETGQVVSGLREGVELLSVERDVSLAAHDAIAALLMHMYEGGRAEEVASAAELLETTVRTAGARLASEPPSKSWGPTHEAMSAAIDAWLADVSDARSSRERIAWFGDTGQAPERIVLVLAVRAFGLADDSESTCSNDLPEC